MNHFDRLPNELVFIIIKKLNSRDLINLRAVNKRFKEISEQSLTDLVVFGGYTVKNCWWLSSEPRCLSVDDLINFMHFRLLNNIFKLESSLKRLDLSSYLKLKVDFLILNSLKNLEYLEGNFELEKNEELILPKLNKLHIVLEFKEFSLRLDCKNLEFIHLDGRLDKLVVNYPLKVKYLDLKWNTYYSDQFKNLEHLSVNVDFLFNFKDKNILNRFKKLNALEFDCSQLSTSLADSIKYYLKQRLVLRRNDLIIRLCGLEIENESMVEAFSKADYYDGFLTSDRFKFLLENYEKLTGYLYNFTATNENTATVSDILQVFGKQIPDSFFKKFFNLNVVFFDFLKPTQQDQCNWFLKNLICLKELTLRECNFTQSFYDNLTINCKYLKRLRIISLDGFFNEIGESVDAKYVISLEFLAKFKELSSFYTDFEFDNAISYAIEAFKQSKHLKYFKCKEVDIFYLIEKQSKNGYSAEVSKLKSDYNSYSDLDGDPAADDLFSANGLTESELGFLSKMDFCDFRLF